MEQDAIISVRGLTAAYGDDVILKDVSFEVKRGEVFVILGGSGSGKSTLLKHLIGLFPLVSGEVRSRETTSPPRPARRGRESCVVSASPIKAERSLDR